MTRKTEDKNNRNKRKSSTKKTSTKSTRVSSNRRTSKRTSKKRGGSHIKKSKINKVKVAIAAVGVVAVVFVGGFLIKTAFNAGAKIWPNVVFMKNLILGSNDKENVDNKEQFDLSDEQKETLEKKTIVFIDVARGGNDKGFVTESGVSEKEVNLKIAENVAKRLSKYNDVTVVSSRQDDIGLSADERKEAAVNENAQLFVSIGTVSANQEDAMGVETIYSTSASGDSMDFASIMQTSVAAHVDTKNRGTNAYDLYILRDNEIPSITVQCGFLSNKSEAKKLLNKSYQDKLAEGIAQGILGYIDAQK